ncbi:hypothetical protein [Actinomadura bangladeshensis]|uniref:Uncharacterized protein n=1 Tax=Actinomadura bangladeshensis TaxID=453573 RepID=A0A6L9QEA2_9ACTN|nr:hypothetical protein [Actinomadura bangladeshensis]NEA23779.1 hypothetical protein [Actinomadura bangladeshensis]
MTGLSGVLGCIVGAVQVGKFDVFGHFFDVAAVRHEASPLGHHEPGLACTDVGAMSLGEGQVAVVECDHLDAYPVWP